MGLGQCYGSGSAYFCQIRIWITNYSGTVLMAGFGYCLIISDPGPDPRFYHIGNTDTQTVTTFKKKASLESYLLSYRL